MEQLTESQKGRIAIRTFKTTADAVVLRGYYKLCGNSGQTLERALKDISPEIYGTMTDPRIIELNGLKYVLDRLPVGLEECKRIVLTAEEDMEGTSFKKILPPKRRRVSYRVGENDMCFVITRGLSEIYDILTHMTFLYIEAKKIYAKMFDIDGDPTQKWLDIEKYLELGKKLTEKELDQAIWNLSVFLGQTYHETKEAYEYFESYNKQKGGHGLLIKIIANLGRAIDAEKKSAENERMVNFTPSLVDMIVRNTYGKLWAAAIKDKLRALDLLERPLHIISANLHSVLNVLYAYGAVKKNKIAGKTDDIYELVNTVRDKGQDVIKFAQKHGFYAVKDQSGSQIDWQIIDTAKLKPVTFHPDVLVDLEKIQNEKPVILVMDYAFGTQAFGVMDELLQPLDEKPGSPTKINVHSISVMGKAGILPGKQGDIILATGHVLEGMPDNYPVVNDLQKEDFGDYTDVYVGTIVTVLGTSLQNKNVLERFHSSDWKAVGLEMEGSNYQRAISAAILQGHVAPDVELRYAYYASDNPLKSGSTLAAGSMGKEGIKPTYLITKTILQKIMA